MKHLLATVLCVTLVLAPLFADSRSTKKLDRLNRRFQVPRSQLLDMDRPLDRQRTGTNRGVAATDTFNLATYTFDVLAAPNPQGWTSHDLTAQIDTFFRVHDFGDGDLGPLEGAQSLWCGVSASDSAPFCTYQTLPGYGNNWDQRLVSKFVPGDMSLTYKIAWDTENEYDFCYVEYDSLGVCKPFPLTGFPYGYSGTDTLVEAFN
jgi:hypothetical protein